MFQRQLLIAEDAGLPVHDAVPLPAQPVQPVHPQPVTHAPHMPHHQPVSHVMPHHSGHHVSIQTKDHHISHGTSTQGKHKYIRVGSYSKITFRKWAHPKIHTNTSSMNTQGVFCMTPF